MAEEATPVSRAQVGDPIMTCPRCGVPAQQVWYSLHLSLPADRQLYPFYDLPEVDDPRDSWGVSDCQACRQRSIWRGGDVVYPLVSVAPTPHAQMPDPVRELYEEARAVLPVSRRAGAALVRAALERLVKELDASADPKARLDDRLARLQGRVSDALGQLLSVVRFLGNEALHVGDDQEELVVVYLSGEDDELAELLFDAINDLVDELIARPNAIQSLWERLPAGVRATVERKRAAAEQAAALGE